MKDKSYNIQTELGYYESGLGGDLLSIKDTYSLRLWFYSDGFTNLNSLGYANPDYESYVDDNLELSFRQPQKGESGLFYKKLLNYSKLRFELASEIWKKNELSKLLYENYFSIEYPYSNELNSYFRFQNKNTKYIDRNIYSLGFQYNKFVNIKSQVSICYDKTKFNSEKSKLYVYIKKRFENGVSLSSRLRWNLEGIPISISRIQ